MASSGDPCVAIVGATGAVGELIRQVLAEQRFPMRELRLLASARSTGKEVEFQGKSLGVLALKAKNFEGVDLVLSSTPSGISKEWSPVAAKAGAIVIDNSSAWRMDPEVPLVVPEVNPQALKNIPKGIVANPNCSTIQMVVALKPLHDLAGIKRIVVSTYQASSGKGAKGLDDLDGQMLAIGRREPVPGAKSHIAQLAGNVLAHDWVAGEDGYSEEEWKMVKETRKILGDDSLLVSPTTVRVPVRVGHSESVHVEFHRPIGVDEAKRALANAPGIVLVDDYGRQEAPTPLQCEGRDEVFVGRLRKDLGVANGLNLWVVADNLRKGAATNAVQIAQVLVRDGLLKSNSRG